MSVWQQLFTRRMLICVFTGFSSGLPLYLLFNLVPDVLPYPVCLAAVLLTMRLGERPGERRHAPPLRCDGRLRIGLAPVTKGVDCEQGTQEGPSDAVPDSSPCRQRPGVHRAGVRQLTAPSSRRANRVWTTPHSRPPR